MRKGRARRKHRRAEELWDPEANKWKKFLKCEICGKLWVCNNYPDRKPRLRISERIGKKKVCIWCRGRNGRQIVQWMMIVEATAKKPCEMPGLEEDKNQSNCKCLPCVARRIGTKVPTKR
jgi:hypothetical protein